ncbi:MAG: DUF4263 domain-containing protein [Opitutae bacterium]|nr:DUF4263 domain-containing protein [Opitutae bacterium]
MKPLTPFLFDIKKCVVELSAFEALLSSKSELSESKDVLPFFRSNRHLLAYLGALAPSMAAFNRVDPEFSLYGDFRADAIIGDWDKKSFCMIEFEDARRDSIYRACARTTKEWSPRFEHGFSQIVDWLWKVDDFRQTRTGTVTFGQDAFEFMGMLVIGRDSFLDDMDRARLAWRMSKVVVNSQRIVCLTFDQLARELRSSLATYGY